MNDIEVGFQLAELVQRWRTESVRCAKEATDTRAALNADNLSDEDKVKLRDALVSAQALFGAFSGCATAVEKLIGRKW